MKSPKKSTWLIILMIISQIMLTGLLAQWLRSQWFDEKQAFQKDINQKFMESVNQVMDSMLVRHLISPVLNDTSLEKDNLVHFNKKISAINEEDHFTAFVKDSTESGNTTVTITIPDSSDSVTEGNVAFRTINDNEKNVLLRSVKLFIRKTDDSISKGTNLEHIISIIPDTILLKSLFENKIGNGKQRYKILWVSDSAKSISAIKSPVMFFRTKIFDKPLHVEILNYRGIILGRIFSQIIFAFTLLFFTGAAFFFTYRSMRKQELLNILRNDFVSNISHELKTPVSTVTIALEALRNFDRIKDPAKSNEYLDIALSEMKRLDQLVSQVLNTSILEEHGEYIKTESHNLVSLTREVLSSMQVRFAQHKATVDFKTDSETISADIDPLYIQGVLYNLLDNSLKYSSGKPEIEVRIEDKPASVQVIIGDNGPGIPEEYISRIFDKFFRVPKGDVHNIKGYGLGLSFAELVMKQHSGKIAVRNKDEVGCEFTLSFPKKNT